MSPLGANLQKNIRELRRANKKKPKGKRRPMRQILAISYAARRKAKKRR